MDAMELPVLEYLPAELAGPDITRAAELVKGYFDTSGLGTYFSGAFFERLDAGGDRPGVRNHITGADVVAVSMLSVDIPTAAVLHLRDQAPAITSHLAEIPWDVDLADAPASFIDQQSAAWALWDLMTGIHGIGWVTANKLLARKRPRLLPVYDDLVESRLRAPKSFWASLHGSLRDDDHALHRRLLAIREAAAIGDDISALRVFDVVCWRLEQQSRTPSPMLDDLA